MFVIGSIVRNRPGFCACVKLCVGNDCVQIAMFCLKFYYFFRIITAGLHCAAELKLVIVHLLHQRNCSPRIIIWSCVFLSPDYFASNANYASFTVRYIFACSVLPSQIVFESLLNELQVKIKVIRFRLLSWLQWMHELHWEGLHQQFRKHCQWWKVAILHVKYCNIFNPCFNTWTILWIKSFLTITKHMLNVKDECLPDLQVW